MIGRELYSRNGIMMPKFRRWGRNRMDRKPNTPQPGGMRWAGWRACDIKGSILGAPAEGTRINIRGPPEGDGVSGQAGKGEAASAVSSFLFCEEG